MSFRNKIIGAAARAVGSRFAVAPVGAAAAAPPTWARQAACGLHTSGAAASAAAAKAPGACVCVCFLKFFFFSFPALAVVTSLAFDARGGVRKQ